MEARVAKTKGCLSSKEYLYIGLKFGEVELQLQLTDTSYSSLMERLTGDREHDHDCLEASDFFRELEFRINAGRPICKNYIGGGIKHCLLRLKTNTPGCHLTGFGERACKDYKVNPYGYRIK